MRKIMFKSMMVALLAMFITSCSTLKTMREPNTRLNLERNDFSLSDQVSAEAQTTRVLGIDWKRLFNKKAATVSNDGPAGAIISLANIPVIGNIVADRTANYALYELMNNNQGYDVVFYPQYETVKKNYVVFSKTTTKVTARLGKLK